jgi:hypothetical protein
MILGGATAGLVAGHFVHYRLAVPHPGHRQALLVATGHGYLPAATLAAIVLVIVAALGTFALGWRRGLRRGGARRVPGLPLGLSMLRLAAAQAAGFFLLEIVERLASGAPLDHLIGPVLLGGIVLQLGIGALMGGLLVLLERSGEAVARALQRPPHPELSTPVRLLPRPFLLPARDPLATPLVIRGPPRLRFR